MVKNMIFPISSLVIAGLTFFFYRNSQEYLILLNAFICVLGFILFLFRASLYKFVLFIWIALQMFSFKLTNPIELPLSVFGIENQMLTEVNFYQVLTLAPESTSIMLDGTSIQINWIALVYFIVFMLLLSLPNKRRDSKIHVKESTYGDESFNLRLFRWNKIMEHIAPQKVEVVSKLDFSESKNWLLIRLTKPVKFKNGRVIYNALIKSKDRSSLKKDVKGQLAHFRVIPDRKLLKEGQLTLDKTRFIDWVFVN